MTINHLDISRFKWFPQQRVLLWDGATETSSYRSYINECTVIGKTKSLVFKNITRDHYDQVKTNYLLQRVYDIDPYLVSIWILESENTDIIVAISASKLSVP